MSFATPIKNKFNFVVRKSEIYRYINVISPKTSSNMTTYEMKCELESTFGWDWNVLDLMEDWEIEDTYRELTANNDEVNLFND